MDTNSFNNPNTDEEIILARRSQELEVWISHLNYVTDESDQLAKIASNKLGDKALRDQLLEKAEQNTVILNEMHNYKSSIEKYNECDDLECDIYYVNLHDTYSAKYLRHLEAYRAIKNQVFAKLLQ
ncbi:hypothetical protein ACFSQP_10655 [Bizionia sediminis]|uniref:Uncharacterized protein n=1 Tax=Bizionia sediminis TaxID=1737064 RepID=A0ABW5KTI7_9FLAO